MTMNEVRRTRAVVIVPSDGKHVIFMRFVYVDLTRTREYHSGSIYRMFLDETAHVVTSRSSSIPLCWDWN